MRQPHLIFLLLLWLISCTDSGKKGPTDSPTQGQIHIAADEAFAPIVAAELNAFHALYPKARIIPHYVNEQKAFELLMADSVRLVICSRDFTDAEREFFKGKTIKPTSVKIATDAIAVVMHPSRTDSLVRMSELNTLIRDKDFLWKAGKISVKPLIVLDKEGGSNELNLFSSLHLSRAELAHPIHYAGGDREVINYVNTHPEAIGFMGLNWISDPDDPLQMRFRSGVRVAALMPDSIEKLEKAGADLHDEDFFQPLQAYLAQGFYPLTRPMMVCSREARSGLGTGFIAWLSSDKGQRIILKAGLLPATMPIRVVKIKKDNDLSN